MRGRPILCQRPRVGSVARRSCLRRLNERTSATGSATPALAPPDRSRLAASSCRLGPRHCRRPLFLVQNNGSEGGPRNDAGRGVPAGFSRVGDRIIVPATSSLRTRLALEEPTMKEVSHTLVLPGLVEADPGRTVKVMPPVTGRVIDLMAQLGGRVAMGRNSRSSIPVISPRPSRTRKRPAPRSSSPGRPSTG